MTERSGKLVRDKIPDIIRSQGRDPVSYQLNDTTYKMALIAKLGEEYGEFMDTPTMEELADIQEVVLALADLIGSRELLESTRQEKADERGTFEQRIFLEAGGEQ